MNSPDILGVRDEVSALFGAFRLEEYPFALLDIFFVALIFYYGYLLIRETRAIRILIGLVVLGLVYVLAQLFGLVALQFLLRSVFAVILVAIPVVFQPELRAGLERLGRTRFMAGFHQLHQNQLMSIVSELAQAVRELATRKVGALIVLEQHDGLRELSQTGIVLEARFGPELLVSIFHRNSPLHDGAVIIRGSVVVAAGAVLPVAGDRFDASVGTRHRAAVGVTRDTDAIAIVVSEETGRISLAVEGKLQRNISRDALEERIMAHIIERSGTRDAESQAKRPV